ncbi:MAG: hypothetical protein IJ043_09930 [Clostridia bacterium]|nr:hypothetical protein [Clostridia bacterium]
MSKLLKFILGGCLILSLSIFGFTPATDLKQESLDRAAASVGYTREVVKTALMEYERTGRMGTVAHDVLLPTSMGIKIPNLDPSKVLNETPLSSYGNREAFYEALRSHGYDDPDMENMPYWQYEQLESNWLLDSETAAYLLASNPELADRDISHWTYGDYNRFNDQKETEILAAWFTAEQLEELEARGIRIEDTRTLLKEFHQPETILAQSDATLKALLEDYYEIKLAFSLGADWRESARIA